MNEGAVVRATDDSRRLRREALASAVAAAFLSLQAVPATAADSPGWAADFSQMSIEDLANIQISSVSKRAEPLSAAAASVYVITNEDIRRSGATSVPEALRLAPNLQVARVDASQYAITARGFNSTTANKLQVLIDGRSVYTPLFSGVFWDAQDVMLEDVERIEVISGPAGVLYGSNAVNGVINIITRSSKDTQGGLVTLGSGNRESGLGARYGAKLGDDATFRVYAKSFARDGTTRANGFNTQDGWNKLQGGFRFDWSHSGDALTLQGDVYRGSLDQLVNNDKTIAGGNLLGRWSRTLGGGSSLQVLAYYDRTRRDYPGIFAEVLETWDLDLQHRFQSGRHEVVWGAGYRSMHDNVTNTAVLAFLPARKTLNLGNVFVQDSIAFDERWRLTLGGKLEHNSYTGVEFQPSARLAWKATDSALLWGSISRAVRTPSRLDREIFVPASAPFLFAGGPNFVSEKVTAYELGYRAQPSPRASFSIATFYNVNRQLRSIEPVGGITSVFANKMEGDSYGVETWGSYRVNDWWRLSAGYNHLKKKLRFRPDSGDTALQGAGNDPAYQFSLRSSMNFAHNMELDLGLRMIGALPNPAVPRYSALDGRLGWTIQRGLQLSLTATNFDNRSHPEFGVPATRSELGRAVYLKLKWSFSP